MSTLRRVDDGEGTQPSQTSRSFLSFPSLLPQLFGVGTTVRVVLYLLHILSTPLDRPVVCLASRVAPHHPNRQPPTSFFLLPPGLEHQDLSRRDDHRWHAYKCQ